MIDAVEVARKHRRHAEKASSIHMNKTIFRSFGFPAAAIGAAVFIFLAGNAYGTTRTVINLFDSGAGSLRQAIANSVNGDTINFSVNGTITLTSPCPEQEPPLRVPARESDHRRGCQCNASRWCQHPPSPA